MSSNNPCEPCTGHQCEHCFYKRVADALETIAAQLTRLADQGAITVSGAELEESVRIYGAGGRNA